MLTGGALVGFQGAVAATDDNEPPGRGARPSGLSCPSGTTEVARYAVEDGSFAHDDGEDVVSFSELPERGPVRSFSWEAETGIAVLNVQFGPNNRFFEGGFSGTVDVSEEDQPVSRVAFCEPRGGRAVLCELDMFEDDSSSTDTEDRTRTYDTEFHLEGSDAGDKKKDKNDEEDDLEGVVHVVSDVVSDRKTRDYAHGMVSILPRVDERISLHSLDALTYDYFEGPENTGAIPDEVFVSFLTEEDQLKLAVKTLNRQDATEDWATLDVKNAIDNIEWSVEDIEFMDVITSTGMINTARELRDAPDETVVLGTKYRNATLAGVGFGAGNTRSKTRLDRCFDDLFLEWSQGREVDEVIEEDRFILSGDFDVPTGSSFFATGELE